MGLSICVGMLADLLAHDPEGGEWLREDLEKVNMLLAANGLPTHAEPETQVPEMSRSGLEGFPYSFIHYLRRVYAYADRDPKWKLKAFPEHAKPTDDRVLKAAYDRGSHLICHSDAEGFYVPVDFDDLLFSDDGPDAVPGGVLGSSYRLMEELQRVAPVLGIVLTDGELSDAEADRINEESDKEGAFWRELIVWLTLFEAARLSLK